MITIKEVKTRKDLRTFAGFNEKMYRDVPQAMPDLLSDEMANFNPKKNPAFEYAESRQWLAYKDGECVGRIGAIISHKANAKWDRKRIRFTRVDFIDDYEVSEALFKTVENWGREKGLKAAHGPMGFCDLDQEGMLIEGFEYDGIFITINNAPYSKPDTLELYLVGVRDQYKKKGLPLVLITEILKAAIEDGMKYAETGPMLEDNIKVQSMWKRFNKIQHRRRRCWIKEI